jgi:hypothetical protein
MRTDSRCAAFPSAGDNDYTPQQGIDIRDHFASLAMQSLIIIKGNQVPDQRLAEQAVQMADALIEALNTIKNPQPY